ncbi:MAG: hypothetical protein KGI67_13690 [Pseudomonadota bacterium]|nr:hypothetical protein [Pseudomonadota bacterium]
MSSLPPALSRIQRRLVLLASAALAASLFAANLGLAQRYADQAATLAAMSLAAGQHRPATAGHDLAAASHDCTPMAAGSARRCVRSARSSPTLRLRYA